MTVETRKLAILLVEDDADLLAILADSVRDAMPEATVVTCANGSEAKDRMNNQAFECIVTDLNMPRVSGIGVIDFARSSRLNTFTPVILITAQMDIGLRPEHEYVIHLVKPFDLTELVRTIREQIRAGMLDQRIALGLVNFVVGSLSAMVGAVDANARILPCVRRATLAEMQAAVTVFTRYNYGAVKPWVGIGLSSEALDHLCPGEPEALASRAMAVFDQLAAIMRRRTLEHMATEFDFKILERLVFTADEARAGSAPAKGVSVPIESPVGMIWVEAVTSNINLQR